MKKQIFVQPQTAIRALSVMLALGFSNSVYAFPDPLNLLVEDPDIFVGDLAISYIPASGGSNGSFTVDQTIPFGSFSPDATLSDFNITNLIYDLDAILDPLGNLLGGTLAISGAIPDIGVANTTLLAGNLTDFGADSGGANSGVFEFLFDVNQSAPALGFGPQAGVILASQDLSGFGAGINFTGSGSADNFAPAQVPEPATLALFAAGALGLSWRTYRQRRG